MALELPRNRHPLFQISYPRAGKKEEGGSQYENKRRGLRQDESASSTINDAITVDIMGKTLDTTPFNPRIPRNY